MPYYRNTITNQQINQINTETKRIRNNPLINFKSHRSCKKHPQLEEKYLIHSHARRLTGIALLPFVVFWWVTRHRKVTVFYTHVVGHGDSNLLCMTLYCGEVFSERSKNMCAILAQKYSTSGVFSAFCGAGKASVAKICDLCVIENVFKIQRLFVKITLWSFHATVPVPFPSFFTEMHLTTFLPEATTF